MATNIHFHNNHVFMHFDVDMKWFWRWCQSHKLTKNQTKKESHRILEISKQKFNKKGSFMYKSEFPFWFDQLLKIYWSFLHQSVMSPSELWFNCDLNYILIDCQVCCFNCSFKHFLCPYFMYTTCKWHIYISFIKRGVGKKLDKLNPFFIADIQTRKWKVIKIYWMQKIFQRLLIMFCFKYHRMPLVLLIFRHK